jgi:hypothetical protein
MADRELIAAIILAGLLARNTTASTDDLARDAVDAVDKLIKALDASPTPTGPFGFKWLGEGDKTPPPGTP